MNNSDFVHLHIHSEYSLLDGLGKPLHYVEKAKELGFRALAVTDHGNIDAHLQWQKTCGKVGIKSILGCELYLVSDMKSKVKGDPHGHVTVLVKNLSGWQALARMLTIANLEGFYYRPRLDFKTFLNNVNSGLVVMTGCATSFLMMPGGVEFLVELGKNRGIDCYLEVMPHQTDGQKHVNELCCELNQKYDLPLVATNDCHYVQADHNIAQEVLLAIQRQAKWKDKDRWRFEIDGLYLKTADEMVQSFKEQDVLSRANYHRAIANTLEVAEKCWEFELPKQEINLPKVPGYPEDIETFLIEKCLSRFKELFGEDISKEFWSEFSRQDKTI
ncbi:MAG: PHP domain-containing protein [Desulfobacterales bacterium]|nr:PHP domain-containing protein [Desulfobacterales bacterium]